MGTATAGRAAMARDAATAGYNPAGMTRLDRSQIMVGALGLDVQSKFDGLTSHLVGPVDTNGNGQNAGIFTPMASLDYVYVASPDLRIGLSVGSYFGLGVDYGDSWQGRYYIQKGGLLTLGVNPSVGYKVNEWLSIGGGATVLYGKLKKDSDDVGYGYNLGVLLEPNKNSRIGVTYRSKIDLKFNDAATAEGVPDQSARASPT
jgi:long-chain fatty acid transport protein